MIASIVRLVALASNHIYIIKNDMVIDMPFIYMGSKYELVLIFKYSFTKFHSDLMCHFWRSFTWRKWLNEVSCKYSYINFIIFSSLHKSSMGSWSKALICAYQYFFIFLFFICYIGNSKIKSRFYRMNFCDIK